MEEAERIKVIDSIFDGERVKDLYCFRRSQFVGHFSEIPEEQWPEGLGSLVELLGQYDDHGFGATRLVREVKTDDGTIQISFVTPEEAQTLIDHMDIFLPSE